jgi:RNA polymerase sigma factor (sigma-70 family)
VPEPAPDFRDQALVHLDGLYSFALSLTRRPPDAEDLVQETYLRAFRFAHRFQPGTHLRAWLFQILRNTFLTFYRREVRELAVLDKDVADGYDEGWEIEVPVTSRARSAICRKISARSCSWRTSRDSRWGTSPGSWRPRSGP